MFQLKCRPGVPEDLLQIADHMRETYRTPQPTGSSLRVVSITVALA